jgi:hypothetical protein
MLGPEAVPDLYEKRAETVHLLAGERFVEKIFEVVDMAGKDLFEDLLAGRRETDDLSAAVIGVLGAGNQLFSFEPGQDPGESSLGDQSLPGEVGAS